MRFLLRNQNDTVCEAMVVAEFQKKHLNDLSMHKALSHLFVRALRALVPPATIIQVETTSLDLSLLTADTNITATMVCSSMTDDAIVLSPIRDRACKVN